MLTYGIFLFLSVFPIIHPKGLTPIPEENMENTELLPLGTEQGREETEYSSFDLCLGESFVSPLVEQHMQCIFAFLIRRNMGTRNISSVTKRFFVLRWRSTLYGSLWASILIMGRPHLIWRNHRHGLSFCLTVMREKSIS